jgi:Ras-related protein Rab-4B
VYDLGNRETFDGLRSWMEDIEMYAEANIIIAIVGNKSDLAQYEVNTSEGQAFANEHNAIFKLISAKKNSGIN